VAKKSRRTTVTYDLTRKRKIVYRGTTKDPKRREEEHREEGKHFDKLKVTSRKLTPESAKEKEEQNLENFRRTHKGKNPSYNDDLDG